MLGFRLTSSHLFSRNCRRHSVTLGGLMILGLYLDFNGIRLTTSSIVLAITD